MHLHADYRKGHIVAKEKEEFALVTAVHETKSAFYRMEEFVYLHVAVDMCQVFRDTPFLEMTKSNLEMVEFWSQAQVNCSYLFPSNIWALIPPKRIISPSFPASRKKFSQYDDVHLITKMST